MGWMVNGGIKWSKVQEVGLSHVGPNLNFKPTTTKSLNHLKKPTPNPKPITVWWPKASRSIISSHVNQLLTLSTHKSSQQKLTHPTVLASTELGQMPPSPDTALIQTHFELICTEMTFNSAVAESICSDKSPTSNCDKALQHDLQTILQEHTNIVIKKWRNSEQWVLKNFVTGGGWQS